PRSGGIRASRPSTREPAASCGGASGSSSSRAPTGSPAPPRPPARAAAERGAYPRTAVRRVPAADAMTPRTILYTGKGGAGKTSVAAATARRLAAGGHRTLIVSTDPAHSLGDVLGAELAPEPRPVGDLLHA